MALIDEKEREDENKPTGGVGDTVPELSTPTSPVATPAAGGANVGGAGNAKPAAPKGSKSGSFQDFSKFQAANKGKIQALGNLTTGGARDTAQGAADNRTTALETARSKIGESYGKPEDYSGYTAGNIVEKAGEVGDRLGNLSGTIDYGKDNTYGAGDALNAEQAYGAAVGKIAGATDRTGVGQLLKGQREGSSSSADAGDSLLLRGNQGFRQNMAQTIGDTQQAFDTATGGDQSAVNQLTDMGQAANEQRADSRGQLIGRLGDIQSGINKAITDKVASDKAAAKTGANTQAVRDQQMADWRKSFLQDVFKGQNVASQSDINAQRAAADKARQEDWLRREMGNTSGDMMHQVGDLSIGQDVLGANNYIDSGVIQAAINDPAKFQELTGLDLNQMFSQQNQAYGDQLAGNINASNTMSTGQAASLNALTNLMGTGGNQVVARDRVNQAQKLTGFDPSQRAAALDAIRSNAAFSTDEQGFTRNWNELKNRKRDATLASNQQEQERKQTTFDPFATNG